MRAILLRETGGPEQLELTDVPDPEPRDDEVVVQVRAAGINFLDVLVRQGRYAQQPELPTIPGTEIAGEVDGRRVIALPDAGKVTLRVRSPVKCRMLFFRDGQALQELKDSTQAELSVDRKGVYRVELYLDQLGGFLEGKPWVISNPIFVR